MKGFKPVVKMATGGLVPKVGAPGKAGAQMAAKLPKPPKPAEMPKPPKLPTAGSMAGNKAKAMAKGGHVDEKEDKALIKKAVKMHDEQLHGGKKTNLTKLAVGGLAGMDKKMTK